MVIKKNPIKSIRKHANELKVYQTTVGTMIKSLGRNPRKVALYVAFHPNIGSFKTGIEEERNKILEEFVLRYFDKIIIF